jgi:hypothetical protein
MHFQEIGWVSVKYFYWTQNEKKVLGSCERGKKALGSAKWEKIFSLSEEILALQGCFSIGSINTWHMCAAP